MKITVLGVYELINYIPKENSVLIRLESSVEDLEFEKYYKDILLIDILDITKAKEKEHENKIFTKEHSFKIYEFVDKYIDCDELVIHCHAGLSRSPAVAISILNYLGRREEALKYIFNHRAMPNRLIMETMNDREFFMDFIETLKERRLTYGYKDLIGKKESNSRINKSISLKELLENE